LSALNPICLRGGVGCSASFLSSSNTTLKYLPCVESFRTTAANLRFSSSFDSNIYLSFTNALMICTFTSMACSLFRTVDNIATPCSVKTYGRKRRPPLPGLRLQIATSKIPWLRAGSHQTALVQAFINRVLHKLV